VTAESDCAVREQIPSRVGNNLSAVLFLERFHGPRVYMALVTLSRAFSTSLIAYCRILCKTRLSSYATKEQPLSLLASSTWPVPLLSAPMCWHNTERLGRSVRSVSGPRYFAEVPEPSFEKKGLNLQTLACFPGWLLCETDACPAPDFYGEHVKGDGIAGRPECALWRLCMHFVSCYLPGVSPPAFVWGACPLYTLAAWR